MKTKEKKIVLVFSKCRSLQTSKNYLLIWRQVYKILKIYALISNTTYIPKFWYTKIVIFQLALKLAGVGDLKIFQKTY